MVCVPVCTTNVSGCFHQLRREGSSRFRLALVPMSFRRLHFLRETLLQDRFSSNVFYASVGF